ncbi:hypothetical protein CDL12_08953 [Handroanthus impetiginosus]|uniref:Uncharacterized protein n=1 Tax=Handroanthus impetiginosus TaxID=429701 RepID=A0A2G9HLG8_9LAMI|nr:hypothetical protein CDL12_08953 [Handroanthus impetiginosus]
MPPPPYFPLRWETTADQWWYASPIDCAAANGHYDLVRELLRLDGNHLIKLSSLRRIRRLETLWDDKEQFHDVATNRSKVARNLLSEFELKKGKNCLIGEGYGGWLLYTAASAGDLSFVRELLERDPLLVFGEGEYGVTDIMYAAARSKNYEVFKVVLDFAASPRVEGHIGETPSAYKFEIMNRALHCAARGGNLKLLKELIGDCSGDVLAYRDVHGATILQSAAAHGQLEVVKDLTSDTKIINSTDNNGNLGLHLAAQRGHLSIVEALILASPSSIKAKNNAGETFLHSLITGFQASGFRRLDLQIDLMKHLLSGKLFDIEEIINEKDNEGKTAFHLANMGNVHPDLLKLLLTISCIKQRPNSGGIVNSPDESARRVIAIDRKTQRIVNGPGTLFRVSDMEIFSYTGIKRASDGRCRARLSSYSSEQSKHDPDRAVSVNYAAESSEQSKHDPDRAVSVNYTAERLKRLLHWPKMGKIILEKPKELVKSSSNEQAHQPIPLREKFSNPSLVHNNKRVLSLRRNPVQRPTAKKKRFTVPRQSCYCLRPNDICEHSVVSAGSLRSRELGILG